MRDLKTEIIDPTTAIRRITGSASMKIGVAPDVSVTKVDDSNIRQIPDIKIISPVWRRCFFWAITYAIKDIAALIMGYKSSRLRDIVPLAFPCKSKWAGRISDKEFQRQIMTKAFMVTIKIGTNQPLLFISIILRHTNISIYIDLITSCNFYHTIICKLITSIIYNVIIFDEV